MPGRGKNGIRDFTKCTTATNPKQLNEQPYEGDPYSGNDNNRRAHHGVLKAQAEIAGEEFDAVEAWLTLGGKEETFRREREVNPLHVADDDDPSISNEGEGDGEGDGEPAGGEGSKQPPAKPETPASAPAWKANA